MCTKYDFQRLKTHSNQNQFAEEPSKALLLNEGGFSTKFQISALTIPDRGLIQKKGEKNVILNVYVFHSTDTQKWLNDL